MASTSLSSSVRLIFGTMNFGPNAPVNDVDAARELIKVFSAGGRNSEIDTARLYQSGDTEKFLCQMGIVGSTDPPISIATKVHPNSGHHPEKLIAAFRESLSALQTSSVQLFYLHAPDRSVPIEDTLSAVQSLYKEGGFQEFGLSNYQAWEVARIWHICSQKGYVLPTVYQGMYNALTRDVETELFACLRAYNIRFYAYNPLCGGLLTGKYLLEKPANRFEGSNPTAVLYRARYWNEEYFSAVESIRKVSETHNLSIAEVGLRWMAYHSNIDFSKGDGIIIGATKLAQLKENMSAFEHGPLPNDVVDVLNESWKKTKPFVQTYWR